MKFRVKLQIQIFKLLVLLETFGMRRVKNSTKYITMVRHFDAETLHIISLNAAHNCIHCFVGGLSMITDSRRTIQDYLQYQTKQYLVLLISVKRKIF